MSCKLKFGVTFHSNMSIEDMALLWCRRVTPEVKAKYPDIDRQMNNAKLLMDNMKLARAAMSRARVLLEAAKKVTVLASASLTQTVGPLVAQYAAEELTYTQQLLVQDALRTITAEVMVDVTCPPDPDEPDTLNKLLYETELDKELQALDDLVNTNLCNTITSFIP